MKKIYLLILLGFAITMNLQAQTQEMKWGLGLDAGGYYNLDTKSLGFSPEAYLSRFISPSFDIMAHVTLGYFGNDNINEPLDMTDASLHLRYKFANGYLLPLRSSFQPYVYAGPGYMFDNAESALNFNAGAGVKYPINQILSLYAEAGYISGIDSEREWKGAMVGVKDDFMKFQLGVEISFLYQRDADKDGVPDNLDQCPNTPEGAIVYAENPLRKHRKRLAAMKASTTKEIADPEEGCPYDLDGDGVYDGIDQCADTPAGVKVDEKGCPLDSDGDGVADYLDKCPDTPAGVKVDENGCPFDADGDGVYDDNDKCPDTPEGAKVDEKGCPIDSDGDGVADGIDKCPDTPKGVKVDENGCFFDADGDGIADENDKCPDTPKGVKVDENGCPDYQALLDMVNSELQPVYFGTAASAVSADQRSKVDNIVKVLNENPEYMVNLYGYSDPRGDEAYNKKLSEKRIDSVAKMLKTKGIDPSRIVMIPYGEEKAPAGNLTDEQLQENRKTVSFMFVSFE